MPVNVNDFANADGVFREQIRTEMLIATANLNRIASLLQAGLADAQVLKEFREAVDRVREAGWIAQQGLDSAQSQKTSEMLFAHRARATLSLLRQLRLELERTNQSHAAALLQELLNAASAFHEAVIACGAIARHKK